MKGGGGVYTLLKVSLSHAQQEFKAAVGMEGKERREQEKTTRDRRHANKPLTAHRHGGGGRRRQTQHACPKMGGGIS